MEDLEQLHLNVDKNDTDVLLEGEYLGLVEDKIRRSNEQTEYMKFALIGIISQFAIFIFSLSNSDKLQILKLDKVSLNIALLILSAGVVVLTTILFLFWLDHALTISTIDKFFKQQEEKCNIIGWFKFREKYSKKTFINFLGFRINLMHIKIQIFRFSIFVSFLTSPFLFILISSFNLKLSTHKELFEIINYTTFSLFFIVLLLGLFLWTHSGKEIYFHNYKNETNLQ